MTVRDFLPSDADHLATLWNGYIRDTTVTFTDVEKTGADILQLADSGPMVALDLDGPVGLACLGSFRGGPGYAHVAELTLMLAPGQTGLGQGAALLDALEDRARERGLEVLVAAISSENTGAQRFFAGHGYVETARMPGLGRKFGRSLDLILKQKTL